MKKILLAVGAVALVIVAPFAVLLGATLFAVMLPIAMIEIALEMARS